MRLGTGGTVAAESKRFPALLGVACLIATGALQPATDAAGDAPAPSTFLVANDDTSVPFPPSTVSFYAIRADGTLAPRTRFSTAGNGMAGGYFGTDRLLVVAKGAGSCVFASNAQSESIAAFDGATHKLMGVFSGSHEDTSLARDGIGLAASGAQLYATFSGSGNIGTFQIESGCKLRFIGDVGVHGLSGGTAEAFAARGHMMVVAYGDGSIESFDISGHLPSSHNDARYSAERDDDFVPDAVDMSSDGHYAIFGGGSTSAQVQVANLSSGKLGATTLYSLGTAWNSGSVRLSPDESILYLSNSSGGRITAAFFDRVTGKVRPGCTSDALRGFYKQFTHIGAVATENSTGTGDLLYVPEFNADGGSSIGIVRFSSSSTGCTLRETSQSPVSAGPGSALLSVAVYPPRPF
jgi:hypothetical protein